MEKKVKQIIIAASAIAVTLLTLLSVAVNAELSSFGPPDTDNGFPMWYQDATGLALGPCLESNRFCHLPLFGEELGFNPFQPVDFPGNFPSEFAYFMVEAFVPDVLLSPLKRYEVALQAGFFNAVPLAGDQVVIVSLRLRVDNIVTSGDYAIVHPYGVEVFRNVPAGGILRLDPLEFGIIGTRLDFETPRQQFVGPFLESADPANKDVLDPVTGNIYLTNPLTSVPVTGSPFNTNVVQVNRVLLDANDNVISVIETIAQADQFLLFGKKAAALDISPRSLAFPEQNVAPVSTDMIITVTNMSPLRSPRLGLITVSGTNAADFTIPVALDGCSNRNLDPSASCAFTVRFSGSAGSPDRTATVTIQGDVPDFSPQTVSVNGSIDSVPPVVLATFPGSNGLAPSNMKIIAQFDDAMAPATVNGNTFTVTAGGGNPVAGTVSFDGNSNIAVFAPSVPLTIGVAYTATIAGIPGGVTDSVGNPMQADFTWSFTGTAADLTLPTVASTNPAAQSGGFATASPLTLTFSEPMLGFTINAGTVRLSSAAAPVDGTVTFDVQTTTTVFTPTVPLAFGTLYTLTVSGVQDLAGNIAPDFTTTFTTNFRPSAPLLLSPSNRATAVSRPVTLRWTRPADQDGDPLSFRVSVCNNASFIGAGPDCQLDITVTASAERGQNIYYAGLGFIGTTLGLVGVIFLGGQDRRRMIIAVVLAPALISAMLLYSCGGRDDDGDGGGGSVGGSAIPQAQAEEVISTQVAGLSPGITFFWKVEADDGKGGTAASEVFTFSTQ